MAVVALRRNVVAVVVVCVTALGAVSGCQSTVDRGRAVHSAAKPSGTAGGTSNGSLDGLTAPQISRRMADAMEFVTSMTMEFSGAVGGKQAQLKIAASSDGTCAAAIRQNGGTMQVIRTADRTSYIKADAAYWKTQSSKGKSIGELAGNRWIKFPATSAPAKRMSRSCDLMTIVKAMGQEHDTATKGGPGIVDGQPVVTIRKKDGQGTSTFSVAARGPSYLLKVEDRTGSAMTFGAFGKPVHVVAPPANQTVDISLFGGDSGLGLDA